MPQPKKIVVTFTEENPTKNTMRYAEDAAKADQILQKLYVKKDALETIGNPTKIRVTIEPA